MAQKNTGAGNKGFTKTTYKSNSTNQSQSSNNQNAKSQVNNNQTTNHQITTNQSGVKSFNMDNFDIVDKAETCIKELKGKNELLTTSKIRKFLTMVITLRNKVDQFKVAAFKKLEQEGKLEELKALELSKDIATEVKFLSVSITYEAGRDANVRAFIEKAQLKEMIKSIGNSVERFDKFAKYVEALVAYHKFEGGRE